MKLEWDEKKRLSNLQKHKMDFIGAEEIFDGYTVTFEDDRVSYGEQRFITFGRLQSRVVAVVHTERDDNIRLISIRKATKHEERSYYSTITN
ncbi:MAG: BrnT family toxin [Pseudomonadota bacterium]